LRTTTHLHSRRESRAGNRRSEYTALGACDGADWRLDKRACILSFIDRETKKIERLAESVMSMRLLGLALLFCCAAPCLVVCGWSANAAADNSSSPAMVTVSVNPSIQHPISPYIYGINIA